MQGGGSGSFGFVNSAGAVIQSNSGGSISISTNSAQIQSTINAGTGQLNIYTYTSMTPIEVGSTTDIPSGPLALSDAELDLVTAGQLSIGTPGCGHLTLTSNITRPAMTTLQLNSADNVVLSSGNINTMGGNLTIDPGNSPYAFEPAMPGTDAICNMISFAGPMEFDIDGVVPDVNYTQLKINGSINLTGATLQLTGSHTPGAGETFIIIDNDGTDAITGIFTGLDQGDTIYNFLVNGIDAVITYVGGTGNDVQIQVVGGCPLMVTNTSDSGTGSLRQAASCAVNGDTIKFHSSMAGQTINITSSIIQFDDDIVILGNVNPRVIISSDIQGMFHVLNQGDVEFINVNMVSGNGVTGSGAAFLNAGILRLSGVQIVRKPTLPIGAHLVKNQTGSQLWLKNVNALNYD